MSDSEEEQLGRRIELLTAEPENIRAPLFRLIRPVVASFGFRATVSSNRAEALLACLRAPDASQEKEKAALKEAVRELEANLVSVERATVIHGRVLVSHAAWLRGMYEVIVRARRAVEKPGDAGLRALADGNRRLLLPPLEMAEPTAGQNQNLIPHRNAMRLLDLELASVDHVLAAADTELELLGRKRRLLEAARQVLLDTSAAVELSPEGLEARRSFIAGEITRIDRLEAARILPDVTLSHQLREAFDRGERDRVHALLVATNGAALAAGDRSVSSATRRALALMWGHRESDTYEARRASLRQSAAEALGADFPGQVERIYADAHKRYEALRGPQEAWAASAGVEYFQTNDVDKLLFATLATDGAFEVGGALTPMRVLEIERRLRAVRFPTQNLILVPAEEPADLADAIVEDPRTVVLDLAAGRLLARRFVLEEAHKRSRNVLRAEVRIYLLDGSTSMHGPRARMRDAMVAAELLTLKHRLLQGAKLARVVLFYRYFDEVLHPAVRVDSPAGVDSAMADVLGVIREGGTDIQAALLESFQQIREAHAVDTDLAEAQIVLVTDGNAAVNEELVIKAREKLGDIAVGLSVIALGTENPALRRLVARQRKNGARAFYHYVPDQALEAISAGDIDRGPCLHLPAVAQGHSMDAMSRDLGALVNEIAGLGRARETEALESLEIERAARLEAGVSESSLSDGQRARALALYRDHLRLTAHYERWFPEARSANVASSADVAPSDVEATLVALATVSEVVLVTSGTELTRKADAIDILERLLPDARLTPARYRAVVNAPNSAVAAALEAVHRTVSPPR